MQTNNQPKRHHWLKANVTQYLDLNDVFSNPIVRWTGTVLLSATIGWAGWTTKELLYAKQVAEDVQSALVRLDYRFAKIDDRLERIETLLMQRGGR